MILDDSLTQRLTIRLEMENNPIVDLMTIMTRIFTKDIHFCGGSKFQVHTTKHKNLVSGSTGKRSERIHVFS